MTIKFPCPSCGDTVNAPDIESGREGLCSRCGNTVVVPGAPKIRWQERWVLVSGVVACAGLLLLMAGDTLRSNFESTVGLLLLAIGGIPVLIYLIHHGGFRRGGGGMGGGGCGGCGGGGG